MLGGTTHDSQQMGHHLASGLALQKTTIAKNGDIRFLVYGQSYSNGTAYNAELAPKPLSTAPIYDSIYVRHWDTWRTTTFNAVFSGTLKMTHGRRAESRYTFSGSLNNLVASFKNLESPYPPFGGSSDYAISPDGQWVAFKSKAPELPRVNYTASYIYLVPHDGSKGPVAINGPDSPGTPDGVKGDSSSPAFSPDSKRIAYFQMKDIAYESDRRTTYVYTIGSKNTIAALAKNWDRSPGALKWTPDSNSLIPNPDDQARTRLVVLPADAGDDLVARNFTNGGSLNSFHHLPSGEYLVSGSSTYSSLVVYTADTENGMTSLLFSANELDPGLNGLSAPDVDEFYFEGSWTALHSWMIYPRNFDKSKTYPLLFHIHGGPQGAWSDSWSTRWNYKVFADQGYVVVAPSPKVVGSYPYYDFVKCWEYVRDNFDFIDTDNSVAAGASYGGFMINWVQGSPLGRKFKALVSHDGVFVADAMIATEELWFMQHDFNGTFYESRDNWRRWDPSGPERIMQFDTPQLIVHSSKDYRLPVAEGLSLFNILQERGVPSRLLNFPDENHWVLNPENSLVWHQQVLGWLNQWSGVGRQNPDVVSLDDTTVPVVDYNP